MSGSYYTLEQRLLQNRIILPSGCWIKSTASPNTYSCIRDNYKQIGVHVAAARLWILNYTSKLLTLHKCNNKPCFNPEHLYQGMQAQNIQDQITAGTHKETSKTHCKFGHPFDENNTIRWRNKRICKQCRDMRNRGLILH